MLDLFKTAPIITLITDFGTDGPFVGSMKGAILRINPRAHIIDITHGINAFDLLDAAFLVSCSYSYFPKNTVHCIVVDPGVGTQRRPVLAVSKDYFFVAPDNGVLSYIYEKEAIEEVVHLTQERFFNKQISNTFHARDIFAPVSAWLAKGVEPKALGPRIEDFIRLYIPKAYLSEDRKRIYAQVIYVDLFGNLLTNITNGLIEKNSIEDFRIMVKDICIDRFCSAYEDVEEGDFGAILGSQGYLELFASKGSLARTTGIKKGTKVELVFG